MEGEGSGAGGGGGGGGQNGQIGETLSYISSQRCSLPQSSLKFFFYSGFH